MNDKDEALSLEQTLRLALEALELCTNQGMIPMYLNKNIDAITAIKAALLSRSDGEAKDEKQKPVNIKKVAEEHGINLPTEFVPKHDESKAAIQSLTDQCAALIWERDELQKQMWRSEKQEPVTLDVSGLTGSTLIPANWNSCVPSKATTASQQTWICLTDEEIAKEFYKFEAAGAWYQFARAIEASVQEKNI